MEIFTDSTDSVSYCRLWKGRKRAGYYKFWVEDYLEIVGKIREFFWFLVLHIM